MWDSFSIAAALGPTSAYFLALGWLRLRHQVWVLGGGRDFAALAFGMMGWFVIGPLDLFFPRPAVLWLGRFVWLFLLVLYWLVIAWIILNMRHRLVIYGVQANSLRQSLDRLVPLMDASGSVTDLSIQLPAMGIEAFIECSPLAGVCQLVAANHSQTSHSWRLLEAAVANDLHSREVPSDSSVNWVAKLMVVVGSVLMGLSLILLLMNPAQTLVEAAHFFRG